MLAATVLAVFIPQGTASTELPSSKLEMNLNNLLPESYREQNQRKILDVSKQAQRQAAEAAERKKNLPAPLERSEVVEAPQRVVQVVQAPVGDCYAAMRATWPQALWAGATIVMQKESGATSNKIGPEIRPGVPGYNSDGSQDFGCFQINNFAHAGFFQSHNWADPYQNAAYAYTIYRSRANWTAWYAVKGILF